jgi:hypothetical protein
MKFFSPKNELTELTGISHIKIIYTTLVNTKSPKFKRNITERNMLPHQKKSKIWQMKSVVDEYRTGVIQRKLLLETTNSQILTNLNERSDVQSQWLK